MSTPAHDPSCIFCKIARGDIPSVRVLETDQALAFLDINPVNPGHTLLVARAHHPTLAELPDDLAAHLGAQLPRLCRAVRSVTGCDGLNIVMNNGLVAGQTIDHVHWHVIPRSNGDAVRWPWPHQPYSGDALSQMQQRLQQALGS